MGIKGHDAISCRGGLGLHVTRGERRIHEMENHLKCLRDKLFMLETMLPAPVTNMKNQDDEPETDDPEEKCKGSCSNLNDKKEDEEQMCVLRSLAIKEKKLREEIFGMECKEKKYLNALSNVKVNQADKEEIKKPEDDLLDLTRGDNFPRSRKGESSVKEKISQLEEYSKKLCYCLRNIQNNRKEWSREAEYLSKKLNGFEGDEGLDNFLGFCNPETKEEKGDECPCGEPIKCNSCTICTCSNWEEDLKIGPTTKENLKGVIEEIILKEKSKKKKSNCRCFQSSSDSKSSKSLEINDIYNCSFSKMQSEMSIATTSIPSTVDNLIIGDEEDKKKFCCLCNPDDECQKFCEICLCEWERKHRANQQLYLDDYDRCDSCEICNQERFRGGMDLGISSEEICCKSLRESLPRIMNKFTPEPGKKITDRILDKEEPSSVETSHISKNLQIEELKLSLQLLKARNNALRKWIQDRNQQIYFDLSKDKIIAALLDERKSSSPNQSKIWNPSNKEKSNAEEMPRKDLAIGLCVLFLTFSSHLLRSSGIFSLSLLFRFLFQSIFFPYRIFYQIYRYLLILCDVVKEFILRDSRFLLNIPQNKILISIFSFIGLISIFLSPLRIIIRSPITVRNFFSHVMNCFTSTFRILFKRKSTLLAPNFIFVIVGFLINKIWNLSEVKINLEFLRLFYNQFLCESLNLERSTNFVNDSTSEEFNKSGGLFSFLNVTLQNIFECVRFIFRSFEIK